MRLVRVLVPNEHRSDVYAVLDEKEFDYVVVPGTDRFDGESVVEIPVSDEGVGDVTDTLSAAGVDLDRYTVVEDLQWMATPNAETIRARYADVYDRPSHQELRSLVDKLNWDVRSFLVMMALSAVVSGWASYSIRPSSSSGLRCSRRSSTRCSSRVWGPSSANAG